MHKAVLENSLRNLAAALRNNHHRHHLRLHIRREAGIGQRLDGHSLQRTCADNAHLVDILLDNRASLTQLCNQRLLMLRQHILDNNIAAGHSSSNHIGTCLNAVRNNRIISAMQLLHALNTDRIGACTADFSAHLVQIVRQIDNLRLLGNVLQNSRALSQSCSHHNILRCANARKIKINARALQALRSTRFDITMALLDIHAQSLKALQMNINRTCTDGAAARHRNACLANTRQQRAHNEERRTHRAHQLIRSLVRGNLRAVDIQHIRLRLTLYLHAQAF